MPISKRVDQQRAKPERKEEHMESDDMRSAPGDNNDNTKGSSQRRVIPDTQKRKMGRYMAAMSLLTSPLRCWVSMKICHSNLYPL